MLNFAPVIYAPVLYFLSYNGVASYNVGPIKYDVAVLKLSKSVSSSGILPMCTKSYSDYTIKVCGLGRTNATDTNVGLSTSF